MMGGFSREKGKRGERMWAAVCRDHGFMNARRGVQYSGREGQADDVTGLPGIHQEVKFVERLNLRDAMDQSRGSPYRGAQAVELRMARDHAGGRLVPSVSVVLFRYGADQEGKEMRAKTVDLPHDLPPERCRNCGKLFTPFAYDERYGVRGRHLCSTECLDEMTAKVKAGLVEEDPAKRGIIRKKCVICGRPFTAKMVTEKYCSRKCAREAEIQKKRKREAEKHGKEWNEPEGVYGC